MKLISFVYHSKANGINNPLRLGDIFLFLEQSRTPLRGHSSAAIRKGNMRR